MHLLHLHQRESRAQVSVGDLPPRIRPRGPGDAEGAAPGGRSCSCRSSGVAQRKFSRATGNELTKDKKRQKKDQKKTKNCSFSLQS
jgi:hypothetical protein